MRVLLSFIILIFIHAVALSQAPTIGLLQNSENSLNGYTFFMPPGTSSYLIDNCGNIVNQWESTFFAGLSGYILENGNLLRTKRVASNVFAGGGAGGGFQIFDWDNNLLWDYTYASGNYHQHHDIAHLPNGNVLVLAWFRIEEQDAISAGRNPQGINGQIWVTQIVEIEQTGLSSGEVVWEWNLFYHLIQDFDETKGNYGVLSEHPELIDFNYGVDLGQSGADWIHANSIDYNEELDLIVISSRNFNEIWVIDHSTTNEESASHSGGNFGKGGDILFRWGNPQTYDRGEISDKKLFRQHDATWIDIGLPNEGKIMVFNNGDGRFGGSYSTVDIIELPYNNNNSEFIIEIGEPFGPSSAFYEYSSDPPEEFYSQRISSAQQLSNGNIFICEGQDAYFFEIDTLENKVWEYISPANVSGPLEQGIDPTAAGDVFRAYRYNEDYSAFTGRDMTPGLPLEINPVNQDCVVFPDSTTAIFDLEQNLGLSIISNCSEGFLEIQSNQESNIKMSVLNLQGQKLLQSEISQGFNTIDFSGLSPSIYLVQFCDQELNYCETMKILKK